MVSETCNQLAFLSVNGKSVSQSYKNVSIKRNYIPSDIYRSISKCFAVFANDVQIQG